MGLIEIGYIFSELSEVVGFFFYMDPLSESNNAFYVCY